MWQVMMKGWRRLDASDNGGVTVCLSEEEMGRTKTDDSGGTAVQREGEEIYLM